MSDPNALGGWCRIGERECPRVPKLEEENERLAAALRKAEEKRDELRRELAKCPCDEGDFEDCGVCPTCRARAEIAKEGR